MHGKALTIHSAISSARQTSTNLQRADYVEWVKFKIELIAEFYDRFCRSSIIGKPVDGFLMLPKQS